MTWYEYRQNNSGGFFNYDPKNGLSVKVYIEADSVREADERARSLGMYFDGVEDGADCSCCGNRWPSAEYGSTAKTPPEKNEPMAERTFYSKLNSSVSNIKWMKEGEAEVFVHPKDGPFYGAHYSIVKGTEKSYVR